ncbi:transposase [Tabrizicola sp.]|uniref:REP-associated tyrosine transposase n=1 Tax=Tabrizicola sp. TaxID=2005166 RepID=UPI0026029672|nr:transposase [Tabrizicola sp.]MDM7932062.1 transposase [Tabrizicola sp.]
MSRYIRPKLPGACVFFTVNLVDRGADTLVRHVDVLRQAVAVTRAKRPFAIDAWVVLPDHMHCLWTLPEGDSDYSIRMSSIKAQFTAGLRRSGFRPTPLQRNEYGANGGRVRVGSAGRVGLKPDLRGDERPEVRRGNEASVWQKRFWEHHIRGDADYAAHVRYCWINPVKHGLVGHPREWPFSSWHRDAGGAV